MFLEEKVKLSVFKSALFSRRFHLLPPCESAFTLSHIDKNTQVFAKDSTRKAPMLWECAQALVLPGLVVGGKTPTKRRLDS